MIKTWDYLEEYKKNKKFFLRLVNKVYGSGQLFFGKETNNFEKNFCKFNKAKYGVSVKNGTDALYIALKAMNIGENKTDEVITVSNTAIPTISAIVSSGARPRFVDVGEDYLMDVNKLKNLINKNTKAIMPVHLYGKMCNMFEILKIAKKYKLKIIEDCAQSFGSSIKNKKAGTWGDAGCFSFYPTKVLGAYGDGGFVIVKRKSLYEKIKRIRFYGIETVNEQSKFFNKYYSNEHGINSRITELQASFLNFKLKKINDFIKIRKKIAQHYLLKLKNTKFKLPELKNNVFNSFVVQHVERDKIIKKLIKKKIFLNINYPFPIHKMKSYKKYVCKNCNCLKNTELISKRIFSLPIYNNLSFKKINFVIKSLIKES